MAKLTEDFVCIFNFGVATFFGTAIEVSCPVSGQICICRDLGITYHVHECTCTLSSSLQLWTVLDTPTSQTSWLLNVKMYWITNIFAEMLSLIFDYISYVLVTKILPKRLDVTVRTMVNKAAAHAWIEWHPLQQKFENRLFQMINVLYITMDYFQWFNVWKTSLRVLRFLTFVCFFSWWHYSSRFVYFCLFAHSTLLLP